MKVGTLTFHSANNFGAVLQAYALQKYLLTKGIESEIIDFYPNANRLNNTSNSILFKILKYLKNPYEHFTKRKKQNIFNEFRKKYLIISKDTFIGDEQIIDKSPIYDFYIVGSDQVWNTDLSNKTKAYYLNFVKKAKKISYAASLGKENFNEVEVKYINNYLTNFDAISVREEILQKKLEKEFSLKSTHVLDPVFLQTKEEWEALVDPIRLPREYVLCYMMEFSEDLISHTKQVAKQLNCTPVFISPSHRNFKGKKINGIGPSEFLFIFSKARYVCTNSFHGTAFSLIFQKDFTVVRHSKLNSRISSIINIAGLNDRFLDSCNFKIDKINYSKVEGKIYKAINKSKDFLDNVLQ